MDNLDGRQARRTSSGSPLGELFDHGCDSLVVPIGCVVASSICQVGSEPIIIILFTFSMLTFFLSTWEEYHTKYLVLRYINGPEEGLTFLYASYFVTFFIGPEFWKMDINDVFGTTGLPDLPMNYFIIYLSLVPNVLTWIANLYSVFSHVRKNPDGSFPDAIQHLITFFLLN